MGRPDPHNLIPPGVYRAADGQFIRVLYASEGTVRYWALAGPEDTAAEGKALAVMTIGKFHLAGYRAER